MRNKLRITASVVLLLVVVSKPLSVFGIMIDDRQRDWDEIMNLYSRGIEIVKEQTLLLPARDDQRRAIFTEAAEKLERWIAKYVPDKNSVLYVRNIYRLGNYWEYAYEFKKAEFYYQECERHPQFKATVFNNAPLADQLPVRLAEVQKHRGDKYTGGGKLSHTERSGNLRGIEGNPVTRLGKLLGKIIGLDSEKTETIQDNTKPPERVTDMAP